MPSKSLTEEGLGPIKDAHDTTTAKFYAGETNTSSPSLNIVREQNNGDRQIAEEKNAGNLNVTFCIPTDKPEKSPRRGSLTPRGSNRRLSVYDEQDNGTPASPRRLSVVNGTTNFRKESIDASLVSRYKLDKKQSGRLSWSSILKSVGVDKRRGSTQTSDSSEIHSKRGSLTPSSTMPLLHGRRGSAILRGSTPGRRRRSSGDSTASLTTGVSPRPRNPNVDGEKLLKKFKFWVKTCITWKRMHQNYLKSFDSANNSQFGEQLMVIDQAAALGIDKKDTFDPSDFKANRQLRLSTEAKRILTKRPEERTQEELTYATIALRSHKQVADYPLRMQRKLAQYGVLESYESKRVIVRQGHPPQGFYFILFGTCIVAIFAPGSEKAKTVAYLSRGESFGELSIISRDKRQSTIITKNYVELLCISATVYEQIFMVGGAKNINDPDHNDFIRSIDCLDGWPIERLQLDPKLFVFSFFKRGGVIVRDSNYSDWIIIVKSGSVQVLKKLVQVNPQVDINTGRLIPQKIVDKTYGYTCFQINQSEYERYLTDNEIELPSPCGGEDADDVPIADVIAEVEASNSLSPSTGAHHRDLSTYRRTQSAFSQAPVMLQTPASIKRNVKSANDKAAKVTQSLLQRRPRLANKLSAHNKKQKSVPEQVPVKTAPDDADDDLEPGFVNQKRTLFDDLDSAYKEREHIVTEADLNPQFVQVQTLTKGSVFGLANIVFDDQPSLCIVSNGAECIMINKKFYLEHCPDALMRRLRTTVSPFPSDDEMQKNLKERVNWDVYRQARLNHVVFDIQQLKMRFNYDAFISW